MKYRMIIFMGVWLAAAPCQAAPGQVLVVFTIESQSFKDGLDQARPATELTLAKNLATQLQTTFPPIDWLTTAPPDGAPAALTASLLEDNSLIPSISLHLALKVGSQQMMLRDIPDLSIYDVDVVDRPYRKPDKLIADINTKVARWMLSARDDLHDDIVVHVPLTHTVDLDKSLQAVLLPLSWERAKLGDTSKFLIEYTPAASPNEMKVLLGGVGEMRSGVMRGNTRTIITSCDKAGLAVTTNVWDTCVAILVGQGAPPFSVRFEHYQFSDHVNGVAANGTAVQP